jgi:hypothetical protein
MSGESLVRKELALTPQTERVYVPDRKAMLAALRVLLGLPRISSQEKGENSTCRSK